MGQQTFQFAPISRRSRRPRRRCTVDWLAALLVRRRLPAASDGNLLEWGGFGLRPLLGAKILAFCFLFCPLDNTSTRTTTMPSDADEKRLLELFVFSPLPRLSVPSSLRPNGRVQSGRRVEKPTTVCRGRKTNNEPEAISIEVRKTVGAGAWRVCGGAPKATGKLVC